MNAISIATDIVLYVVLLAVAFLVGLVVGGREGYFLLFYSLAAGNRSKSYDRRLVTKSLSDIPYGPEPDNLLDVYVPDEGGGPFPVLVFFHGGKWMSNSKNSFSYVGLPYLKNGIMFVSVGYRLAPAHPYPAAVADCQKAVQWVYNNIGKYGGDRDRVFVSGHSAGGHLCALITANNEWIEKAGLPQDVIKGCIVVSGPTDLSLLRYREVKHFVPDKPLLSEASPVTHVRKGLPPFLVVYGTGDIMVPPQIPRNFVARLKEFGVKVTEVELILRTHMQTLDVLGDPCGMVVPQVIALVTGEESKPFPVGERPDYDKLEREAASERDFFQRLAVGFFVKAQ